VTAHAADTSLVPVLIQIADDHLILGHRLSEWCGHAPMLEEDLSMPNMALDLIGLARQLYTYAAALEGKQRSEDDLAYLRSDREYRNCLLVERDNVDFAHTMLRQFYFASFMKPFWHSVLNSTNDTLASIAAKAEKEVAYHVRHSGEWVIRLGDGTEESARRMRGAVEALHPYTGEMFVVDGHRTQLVADGVLPEIEPVRAAWQNTIDQVFNEAGLVVPEVEYPLLGGRDGRHTEAFGYLLAELQYMQRAYPGAQW
jgi:ring-1,2-phenylacetyl-CoA epoxidase subunit PaaC